VGGEAICDMKYFQEAAGIKGQEHFKGLMREILKEIKLLGLNQGNRY